MMNKQSKKNLQKKYKSNPKKIKIKMMNKMIKKKQKIKKVVGLFNKSYKFFWNI